MSRTLRRKDWRGVGQSEGGSAEPAAEHFNIEAARQPDVYRMHQRVTPLRRHRVGLPYGYCNDIAQSIGGARPKWRDAVKQLKIGLGVIAEQRFDQRVVDIA